MNSTCRSVPSLLPRHNTLPHWLSPHWVRWQPMLHTKRFWAGWASSHYSWCWRTYYISNEKSAQEDWQLGQGWRQLQGDNQGALLPPVVWSTIVGSGIHQGQVQSVRLHSLLQSKTAITEWSRWQWLQWGVRGTMPSVLWIKCQLVNWQKLKLSNLANCSKRMKSLLHLVSAEHPNACKNLLQGSVHGPWLVIILLMM